MKTSVLTGLYVTLAYALFSGCSVPASQGGGTSDREQMGYVCSSEYACPDTLRCYKRYPTSVGRCVSDAYYDSHPRGCYVDSDCNVDEACVDRTKDWAGKCIQSFRSTPETETKSPAPTEK